jgi:copper homeostasis protein
VPKRILEIIACSLDDARAAFAGGADRLEVCANLDQQGHTPAADLVETIVRKVAIPVRVMIRTPGDDILKMEEQVEALSHLPVEGMIFGVTGANGGLDFTAMDRVLRHAPSSWAWTLHRAFDWASGTPEEKLAAVVRHGRADRILTGESWHLTPPASLQFIAGGGINTENLARYLASPCLEFHFGRAARNPPDTGALVDKARIRVLRDILDNYANCTDAATRVRPGNR